MTQKKKRNKKYRPKKASIKTLLRYQDFLPVSKELLDNQSLKFITAIRQYKKGMANLDHWVIVEFLIDYGLMGSEKMQKSERIQYVLNNAKKILNEHKEKLSYAWDKWRNNEEYDLYLDQSEVDRVVDACYLSEKVFRELTSKEHKFINMALIKKAEENIKNI